MFNIREGDLRVLMFRRKNQIHWRIKTVKYFLLYYCYSYFVRLIKRVGDSLSNVCRCCKQISPDVFLNNKLVFFLSLFDIINDLLCLFPHSSTFVTKKYSLLIFLGASTIFLIKLQLLRLTLEIGTSGVYRSFY
jgi:hypothetical protein